MREVFNRIKLHCLWPIYIYWYNYVQVVIYRSTTKKNSY